MSLLNNIREKLKSKDFNKSIESSKSEKYHILPNNCYKSYNKSLLFDTTYNLFKNNKNNNYSKIIKRKLATPDNKKYRNKTTNIKIYTDFFRKKKYNLKKNKTNYELMEKKRFSKINSIIINISNSQFNKTNNNSFRKVSNTQMNEKFFNNKNNDYFYDFTINKKQNNDNDNNNYFYNSNTYNVKFNKNNYHKKKQKIKNNNMNSKEKINFKLDNYKKPIKIKLNLKSNEIDNKIYINKYNSTNNKDESYNIKGLNKYISSNIMHNNTFNKKLFNTSKESQKDSSAEKNYLKKWQIINGVDIEKKYSLSHVQSKKQINKIPKKYTLLSKKYNLSERERENNNIKKKYYSRENININNIKCINTDIYNNTDINNNKLINDYKTRNKKHFETENLKKKITVNNEENDKKINYYYQNINENKNEIDINTKKDIDEEIERKKREIDLLNVMKFTSEIYDNNIQNNNNNNNNDQDEVNFFNKNTIENSNIIYFNNKNLFNTKYHKMTVIDYDDNNDLL
jgi:hypothetical protein